MSEAAAALAGTRLALELLPEAWGSSCWLPAGRPEMRLSPPLATRLSFSLCLLAPSRPCPQLSLPPLWTPIQTASIEMLLKRIALARLCRLGRPWSHPAGGLCADGDYSGGLFRKRVRKGGGGGGGGKGVGEGEDEGERGGRDRERDREGDREGEREGEGDGRERGG